MYVDFSNFGVQEATVKLRSIAYESILKIEPAEFTLHSNETRKIMLEVQCDDLGEFREAVMVDVIGGVENNLLLDVVAQVVTQKLTLLSTDNGASLDSIAFGGLYYGQKKEIHALLVNSGPKQLSFSVSYADEDDGRGGGASIVSPADDQVDLSTLPIEKFMNILPSDGVVNPFSQLPVVIRFIPELPVVTKGFSKQLTMVSFAYSLNNYSLILTHSYLLITHSLICRIRKTCVQQLDERLLNQQKLVNGYKSRWKVQHRYQI